MEAHSDVIKESRGQGLKNPKAADDKVLTAWDIFRNTQGVSAATTLDKNPPIGGMQRMMQNLTGKLQVGLGL